MRIPLGKTVNQQLLQDLGFNLNTIYSVDENFFIKLPHHLTCNQWGSGLMQYAIKYENLLVMSGFEQSKFWDYEAVMDFKNENVAIVKAALAAKKESSTTPDSPHPAFLFSSSGEAHLKNFNAAEAHPASIPADARTTKTFVPRLTARPITSSSPKNEDKITSTKKSTKQSNFQKSNYTSSLAKNINNIWQTQNKTAVLLGCATFITAGAAWCLNKMR